MRPPIDRNPSAATLRGFAAVLAGGTTIASLVVWLLAHRSESARAIAAVGLVLVGITFVPVLGRWLYVAWMRLGAAIGWLTGPVVLAVIYFGVVLPIGLVSRWTRPDPLRRERRGDGTSYWEPSPEKARPSDYFRPF